MQDHGESAAPLIVYELTRKGAQNKRDVNRRIEFSAMQTAWENFGKLEKCLTTEPNASIPNRRLSIAKY